MTAHQPVGEWATKKEIAAQRFVDADDNVNDGSVMVSVNMRASSPS